MNLHNDIVSLRESTTVNENNIGLAFFENLKKTKPIFYKYQAETLYRAYLMEYIILLWDNAYYLLINNSNRSIKLRGISNDLLGTDFLNSTGYRKLVETEDFLEHNYFSRYSLIRYLTQAWTNYLYNKQEHYRYIPLNRIYGDKVKSQYLELSQGLADYTVFEDNLSFTDDPATIAILNYYYFLDNDMSADLIKSFEVSLSTSLNEDVERGYKKVKATKDKALIMHYINAVGIQEESFTASYGDNLVLNRDVMHFNNSSLQELANNYLANGNENSICSVPVTLTISISRFGLYYKLLGIISRKLLGCSPLIKRQLNKYKELGFTVSNINKVYVGSSNE